MQYILTKEDLFSDLKKAFECAKKHKSRKSYVIEFEKDLDNNLSELCEDLWNRKYEALPSYCFIINHPKMREIFAANFRDRIVHHLYYNYVYGLFENTFITDSYSCRDNKGTHYGIKRLSEHIRKESLNYQQDAYILKMDIKGYFIHINRNKLLEITLNTLDKMSEHKINGSSDRWTDVIDFDFIKYLSKKIILLDPTKNCIYRSNKTDWIGLPKSKSLFKTKDNCGLPIGNLTSQLLSNVYLNVLDQYIKRELKCRHYGRYVDDFYIVSNDKDFLKSIIPMIDNFLKENLGLEIHHGKTIINNYNQGVEFLGAYIKPYRNYISNKTLKRIKRQLYEIKHGIIKKKNLECTVNSFLGVFSHYKSYNIKKDLSNMLIKFGNFNKNYTKYFSYH